MSARQKMPAILNVSARMMRRVALAISALVLVTGCEPPPRYDVSMEPEDGALKRTFHLYRMRDGEKVPVELDAERLQELAKQYGLPEIKQLPVTGRFRDFMPRDVGGYGRFLHLESPLGSASIYLERFRGAVDFSGEAETIISAADRMAGKCEEWLAHELGEDDRWPELRSFLRGPFRRDIANLAFLFKQLDTAQVALHDLDIKANGENGADLTELFLMRAALFLAERDYLRLSELPALIHLLRRLDDSDEEDQPLDPLPRIAARRMGVAEDEPLPESLAFLRDTAALKESRQRFEDSFTDEDAFEEWRAELDELKNIMLVYFLPGPPDRLHIQLAIPEPPVISNGLWDAANGKLTWDRPLRGQAKLSPVAYAVWVEPDREMLREPPAGAEQQNSLLEWILHYNALSPEARRRWDVLLESFDAGRPLEPQIEDLWAGLLSDRGLEEPLEQHQEEDILSGLEPNHPLRVLLEMEAAGRREDVILEELLRDVIEAEANGE